MVTRTGRCWPWLAVLAACGGAAPDYVAPAAVAWDPIDDVCIVANQDGSLARERPDGSRERFWIRLGPRAAAPGAAALAVAGDRLWLACGAALHGFARATGAPIGVVDVPGATALTAVAADEDGVLWCADAATIWRAPAAAGPPFAAPVPVLQDQDLGGPVALVARRASVYVVARDGRFYSVDAQGRRTDLVTLPDARPTGLARGVAEDGRAVWFVADEAGGGRLHRLDSGGGSQLVPGAVPAPGELDFDARRGVLLVPLRSANRIERVRP
ncbi:MAG: hypothetical protein JNL08_10735 [Planctomycetes bacterium]|nr:hypothetical protein [Planctomycetota bacterium]